MAVASSGWCADFAYDATGRLTGAAGAGNVKISYTYDDAGNITGVAATPYAAAAPFLVGGTALTGTVGSPFSQTLASSRIPAVFAAANLPPGLALNGGTGSITGTPTTAGVFSTKVTVTSGGTSAESPLIIHILPPSQLPTVVRQPESTIATIGQRVTLSADIEGKAPLSFQWRKDGAVINGATGLSHSIPSFTQADTGAYTLTATNNAGSVTTLPATLFHTQTFATGNNPSGLPVTHGGTLPWSPQTTVTRDGMPAMQSGAITHGGTSIFETTVTGPGVFVWYWKTSSESNDRLYFHLNGSQIGYLSGETDWQPAVKLIEAGTHTLRWSYIKSNFTTAGQDKAWVSSATMYYGWAINAVPTGNGEITRSPAVTETYPNGSQVTLTAVPAPGHYFAGWSGDLTGTMNPAAIAMTSHRSLTAIFKEDLGIALGAYGLKWITGGNADWKSQSFVTKNDGIAASSGAIGNNQSSWVETTVTGPGNLSWWWKVSSETGYDKLIFSINGVAQEDISGEADWANRVLSLGAGSQTLRWSYVKDIRTVAGVDTAWLDEVRFLPAAAQSFNDWVATWNLPPGKRGRTDDANDDGIPNLLAFAFGVPPMENATANLPVVSRNGSNLTITYKRSKKALGIAWTPQVSDNLVDFRTTGITHSKVGEDSEVETWTATVTTAGFPKRFLRINVE
ncbi:MAG: immunoglobulin domain-containing protein [Akkermansiaceae bacterium]|nr:immunoglobulin domain-containing protein [Akkermansiaceae bacterium]